MEKLRFSAADLILLLCNFLLFFVALLYLQHEVEHTLMVSFVCQDKFTQVT